MTSEVTIPSIVKKISQTAEDGATLYDVTSLLQDRKSLRVAIDQLAAHFANANIEKVVGIESRGFIMGASIAEKLGVSFALMRKKGHASSLSAHHSKTLFDMHANAIKPNERILLIDDLIASGGSMLAAVDLIKRLNGEVAGCGFIINLADKGGMQHLSDLGLKTHALCTFEGE